MSDSDFVINISEFRMSKSDFTVNENISMSGSDFFQWIHVILAGVNVILLRFNLTVVQMQVIIINCFKNTFVWINVFVV